MSGTVAPLAPNFNSLPCEVHSEIFCKAGCLLCAGCVRAVCGLCLSPLAAAVAYPAAVAEDGFGSEEHGGEDGE